MTLKIKGFDFIKGTISDMAGGLYLLDCNNNPAAIWSFNGLITHWSRKHSQTCYVNYKSEERDGKKGYIYNSPVYFGESTDLSLFLKTMQAGLLVYDPATKVVMKANGTMSTKPRNQFRISFKNLKYLYQSFCDEDI